MVSLRTAACVLAARAVPLQLVVLVVPLKHVEHTLWVDDVTGAAAGVAAPASIEPACTQETQGNNKNIST